MPHKTWKHNCPKDNGREVTTGAEICDRCGQRGECAGWGLSMIETMGAYQLRTGFKPMGPHRQMVHDLLDSRMDTCPQCQGRGVIDAENGDNYQICPTCKMTQYVFDSSPEEWQALHEQIKSKYPDEAVISRATGY